MLTDFIHGICACLLLRRRRIISVGGKRSNRSQRFNEVLGIVLDAIMSPVDKVKPTHLRTGMHASVLLANFDINAELFSNHDPLHPLVVLFGGSIILLPENVGVSDDLIKIRCSRNHDRRTILPQRCGGNGECRCRLKPGRSCGGTVSVNNFRRDTSRLHQLRNFLEGHLPLYFCHLGTLPLDLNLLLAFLFTGSSSSGLFRSLAKSECLLLALL
mmetsp:Transcript_9441/g.15637  ORF Transcript_9441/g.15637 Transcript_9441/m.15637 type:complete len:215 (+) Transcript_9441:1114-1758(+)